MNRHFGYARSLLVVGLLGAFLSIGFAAPAGAPRRGPDFGLMLNDDGGLSFMDSDPRRVEAGLRRMIRSLEGTGVKTLIYQVVAGSETMLYPTTVGSAWGWRNAPGESAPPWNVRMPFLRAAVANRLDAGRIAAEEAKSMGMYFMPAYRMNDAHFSSKPFDHPVTGRFWIENHERLRIGQSPFARLPFYANLLDFTHQEVRDHRLAIIREIVGRYADIMDGLQLDFMRHPFFFPPGTGESRQSLMTELMLEVRQLLDAAGKRQGRFLALSVRIPPTLRGCQEAGLDVRTWLQRRLVDVLVLSPSMILTHDMPLDEFVGLVRPAGARVYAAIFRHTTHTWPYTFEPTPDSYLHTAARIPSSSLPAQVRGAALSYRGMNADGFELYNFNLPAAPSALEVMAALAEPQKGMRVYAITPAYASDRENLVEYRKQIPVSLSPGAPAELTIIVGEKQSGRDLPAISRAALRLGVRNIDDLKANLVIELNGRSIHDGPMEPIAHRIVEPKARPSRIEPPRAEYYLQIRVSDRRLVQEGRNRLTLRLRAPSQSAVEVVEVQMAFIGE